MTLADLGERVGVDLWRYQTPDGRSIRKAIEYLALFAFDERQWTRPTSNPSRQSLAPLLRRAATHYRDSKFQAMLAKVPDVSPNDRSNLLKSTSPNPNAIEE